MRFLCFFMASGHTKANYIEIVCHVSTIVFKKEISKFSFPQGLRKDLKYSSIQIGQEGFSIDRLRDRPFGSFDKLRNRIRDRGILKKIQTAWWFGFFYVPLPSKSIIILKPLKNETT